MKRTRFLNAGNRELRVDWQEHEGAHSVPDFARLPLDAADAARLANWAFDLGYEEALRNIRETLGLKQ